MTIKNIALVIQEVYNQGHVKAGEQKLEYEDFLQLVYMARGEVLYEFFRQEQLMGLTSSINNMIKPYELTVQVNKYGRKVAMFPDNIKTIQLPGNAEVYSVIPLENGKEMECRTIIRTPAGSEWLYCNQDDDVAYFVPYVDRIEFYNLSDCIDKMLVYLIANDETSEVPDDLAFKVAKAIWQQVFRTVTLPVDKRTDGNPNYPDDIIREKLSSPEINR